MKHYFAFILLLCGLIFAPTGVAAAESKRLTVSNTAQLREALASVAQNESLVILLQRGGIYTVDPVSEERNLCRDFFYPVSADLPLIEGQVTIRGRGATLRGVDGAVMPFCVTETGSLTLRNITITEFALDDPALDYIRPSVAYIGGEARILDSEIRDNGVPGAAPYTIENQGSLHIEVSVIANNVASHRGAGIYSRGRLTLLDSSIIDNSLVATSSRGSVSGAGLYMDGGEAWLRNVTISGNEIRLADNVPARGIVLQSDAPAIYAGHDGLLIEHATIVNNVAAIPLRRNSALDGGGIVIRNSIIANNTEANCYSFHNRRNITLQGINLVDDNTCGPTGSGVLISDPGLAALKVVNGLPVHVPLPASPALNSADPMYCPSQDELGRPRNVTDAESCEVGAVERLPVPYEINQLLTATWYDPQHDGHYLSLDVLPDNRLFALCLTYTPDGEQLWLYGVGEVNQDRARFTVYESRGMALPELNPEARRNIPWGLLTVQTKGCGRLVLSWQSEQAGFATGQAELVRLTRRDVCS